MSTTFGVIDKVTGDAVPIARRVGRSTGESKELFTLRELNYLLAMYAEEFDHNTNWYKEGYTPPVEQIFRKLDNEQHDRYIGCVDRGSRHDPVPEARPHFFLGRFRRLRDNTNIQPGYWGRLWEALWNKKPQN